MSDYKDQQVLDWINEIRAGNGLKPLQRIAYANRDATGKVYNPRTSNCPIARSLGGNYSISEHSYFERGKDYTSDWHRNPDYVAQWIARFDEEDGK